MDKHNKQKGQEQGPGRRNRDSDSFRDQIIRYLHDEKGFSWPKAERGFRRVLDVIAENIRCGEVVELPGLGTIKSVLSTKPQPRYWKPLWNVHTGKAQYRVVPRQRRPRRITFKAHPWVDLTPPPPPTPAEIETRQLAAELLGRPVDDRIMAELQAGVDIHAHRPGALYGPGALLRRLRHLKNRGRRFEDATSMAWAVAELYWI
jgi:nucleoid DNA-binding protein